MKTRHLALPAVLGIAALALTGCGTTQPAASDGASGDTITVTDSRGQEIELNGPATRVVGTEWNVLENLASLGVQPVGAADVEGYATWVTAAKLDADVTDIGTRGEPSIDAVAALNPDLVVATTDLPETAIAQLEEFVPVLVVKSADGTRPIEQMTENLELIAQATGTEDVAAGILADFETTLADGAAAIEKAGLTGTGLAFVDGWLTSGQVSIRPYTGTSLIGAVNTELGLSNPWTIEGDAAYGLASTDVEGLTALGDVQFAYIHTDTAPDPFTEGLAGNAIWQSLPFVQNGEVHRLDNGIWMFGGPASMSQYVDSLVGALTA